jgi:hypothetical protein
MVYGRGCNCISRFIIVMTFVEIMFFWLLISTTKYGGVPFTNIYEWKRRSQSLTSFDWAFVVMIVALGSMLMLSVTSQIVLNDNRTNPQGMTQGETVRMITIVM